MSRSWLPALLAGCLVVLLSASVVPASAQLTSGRTPSVLISGGTLTAGARSAGAAPQLPWTGESIPVTPGTSAMAFDPASGLLFVTGSLTASVSVINTTTNSLTATAAVGSDPTAVTYDPLTGYVYVANQGSNNLTVLNGSTGAPVGSITLGPSRGTPSGPEALAVDPVDHDLYVGFGFTSGTAVLDPTNGSVVTVIPIQSGANVEAIVFDPASNEMLVAPNNFSFVQVDDASSNSVVTTIPGVQALGLFYDPPTAQVWAFVDRAGGAIVPIDSNGSVGSPIMLAASLAPAPMGAAYDPTTGDVFVACQLGPVYLVNGSSDQVIGQESWPAGIAAAFDPTNAEVYVAGWQQVLALPSQVYPVTVNEAGLPVGEFWQVNVSSPASWAWIYPTAPNATSLLPNGTYNASPDPFNWVGYQAVPASLQFTVAGAANVLNFTFLPTAVYDVTFAETGLAPGSAWSVTAGAIPTTNGTRTASVTVLERAGTLSMLVTPPSGFGLASLSGAGVTSQRSVDVGANVTLSLGFGSLANVTFVAGGLQPGTSWTVVLSSADESGGPPSTTLSSTSDEIVFAEPPGGFDFSVSTSPGQVPEPASGAVTVDGAPVSVGIAFRPASAGTPYIVVSETGLPASMLAKHGWTVVAAGAVESYEVTVRNSTSTGLSLQNGSYAFLVLGPAGYVAHGPAGVVPTGTLTVAGNTSVPVTFSKGRTATLTVAEKGLPSGTVWCVTVGGLARCLDERSVAFADLTPATYGVAISAPPDGATVTARFGASSFALVGGEVRPLNVTRSATLALTFTYRYNVTFTETGLPAGGTWSVTIKGVLRSAASGSPIVASLANGVYRYSITAEAGYVAHGTPTKVRVTGAPAAVEVGFSPRG